MRFTPRLLLSFTLVALFNSPASAQFSFQRIDVPGAIETQVRGINNHGEIVGFYRLPTDACIPIATPNVTVPPCDQHGFKIVHGKLTTVMVPGSLSTAIMGVNDAGDLVGYYTKTSDACIIEQHGFLWSHRNVISSFDFSGSTGFCGTDALWTVPFSINNQGAIVGTVWSVLDGGVSGAFLYKNGQATEMNPTRLEGGCFTCATLFSINNNGTVAGTAYRVFGTIPMWTAFLTRGSDEIFFTRTQDDTWATGVNAAGDVVGYGEYGAGFFIRHLGADLHRGKTIVDPTLIAVGYPDAAGTYPFAVNNARIVVGTYMSVDATLHGFIAVPRPETKN